MRVEFGQIRSVLGGRIPDIRELIQSLPNGAEIRRRRFMRGRVSWYERAYPLERTIGQRWCTQNSSISYPYPSSSPMTTTSMDAPNIISRKPSDDSRLLEMVSRVEEVITSPTGIFRSESDPNESRV